MTELSGRYRLLSLLGRGGMGEVYEALHTALGHRVVIELIRADRFVGPRAPPTR